MCMWYGLGPKIKIYNNIIFSIINYWFLSSYIIFKWDFQYVCIFLGGNEIFLGLSCLYYVHLFEKCILWLALILRSRADILDINLIEIRINAWTAFEKGFKLIKRLLLRLLDVEFKLEFCEIFYALQMGIIRVNFRLSVCRVAIVSCLNPWHS